MVLVMLLLVVFARAAVAWISNLEVAEFLLSLLSIAIAFTVGRMLFAGNHSIEERGSAAIRMQRWAGDSRYPAVSHHVAR